MFLISYIFEEIALHFFQLVILLLGGLLIGFILIMIVKFRKIQIKRNVLIIALLLLGIGAAYKANVWYTSPLAGYSEQFIESNGGAYTHQKIFMYEHFRLYPNASGTISSGIGGDPTQEDVDLQVKIVNELNKQRDLNGFGIGSEEAINPELDYSGLDEDIPIAINYMSDDNDPMPESEVYVKMFSGRNDVTIWNSAYGYLSFEGTEDIKTLDLSLGWNLLDIDRIDLEGIENVEQIIFQDSTKDESRDYIYYPQERLDEFLHDWGWIDEDGYYGKIYSKPNEDEMYKEPTGNGGVNCDKQYNGERGNPPESFEYDDENELPCN